VKHISEDIFSDTQQDPELDTTSIQKSFPSLLGLSASVERGCWHQEGFWVEHECESFANASEMCVDDKGL